MLRRFLGTASIWMNRWLHRTFFAPRNCYPLPPCSLAPRQGAMRWALLVLALAPFVRGHPTQLSCSDRCATMPRALHSCIPPVPARKNHHCPLPFLRRLRAFLVPAASHIGLTSNLYHACAHTPQGTRGRRRRNHGLPTGSVRRRDHQSKVSSLTKSITRDCVFWPHATPLRLFPLPHSRPLFSNTTPRLFPLPHSFPL